MSLIALHDVTVRFGGAPVLEHVDLSIASGEIVTLVGPNGSGKTTLLRTIIGSVTPDEGRVERKPNLRVGYVPQKLAIDGTLPLTAERFLALPGKPDRDAARRALDVAGVPGVAEAQLGDLSGGQLQRVLLARAIMGQPELLILDEATQGLDQSGSAAFYQRIEMLRQETGAAVLMVSHELHVVMAASDRVICLNGHVCCEGHPAHVASAPEYRALFGSGTGGALALYRHEHDHHHHHEHEHGAPH